MGEPVKLTCRICESEYFLHPASEKPVELADMCNECADRFKQWVEELNRKPGLFPSAIQGRSAKNVTLGVLIVGLSAISTAVFIGWLIWSSVR